MGIDLSGLVKDKPAFIIFNFFNALTYTLLSWIVIDLLVGLLFRGHCIDHPCSAKWHLFILSGRDLKRQFSTTLPWLRFFQMRNLISCHLEQSFLSD